MKYANKFDMWFHTKDIHGSHVILRLEKNENVPLPLRRPEYRNPAHLLPFQMSPALRLREDGISYQTTDTAARSAASAQVSVFQAVCITRPCSLYRLLMAIQNRVK